MSLAYEAETARRMLADVRQNHIVAAAQGFELRAPASTMPELLELFTDPIWESGAALLRHRIKGFAVFHFPLRIPKQPVSEWIFLKAHNPVPTADRILYYALRRVVLLRYLKTGVAIHFFNRRPIITRAERLAERVWQRHFRK